MSTPLKAIILAGGFGTRLQSVVKDIPKPMAPVREKPFLEYLLLSLRTAGVSEVVLATGYRSDIIESYFRNGAQWNMRITYSREETPLGTGGALKQAAERVTDRTFFALNGDSFFAVDAAGLAAAHRAKNAVTTLTLARVPDAGRYGTVAVGEDGAVSAFCEKGASGAQYINSGFYCMDRSVLSLLPPGKSSLEHDLFPGLIGKGLYAFPQEGEFIDIGMPEDYQRLCTSAYGLVAGYRV